MLTSGKADTIWLNVLRRLKILNRMVDFIYIIQPPMLFFSLFI